MTIDVRPFPSGAGAEVLGYAAEQVPDRDTVAALRQALIRHHFLLFRGRPLDPPLQIRLTRVFGDVLQTCSPRNRFLSEFPEIFRVANRPGEGHLNIGPYWHSDGAYLEDPTAVSVHHMVKATKDGDTLYADLAAAYERLPPERQSRLAAMYTRSQTGCVHPLVIRHPVTKRSGLYVNMEGTSSLHDESGRHDRETREFLTQHLAAEGTYYRHQWRDGDTIVVDNFAVAHHATRADPSAVRVLHRTSIHGPSVWWRLDKAPGRASALTPSSADA
jgi:taurine dioxygenase